jgi:hypothetical protein
MSLTYTQWDARDLLRYVQIKYDAAVADVVRAAYLDECLTIHEDMIESMIKQTTEEGIVHQMVNKYCIAVVEGRKEFKKETFKIKLKHLLRPWKLRAAYDYAGAPHRERETYYYTFLDKCEDKYPVRKFLMSTAPDFVLYGIPYNVKSLIFSVKTRVLPSEKYHIIPTGLKPNWYQTDTRILYGIMNLIKYFVENELKEDFKLRRNVDEYNETLKEIMEIYKWWINYDERQRQMDEVLAKTVDNVTETTNSLDMFMDLNSEKFDEYDRLEAELDKETTEMLCKAIKLRHELY